MLKLRKLASVSLVVSLDVKGGVVLDHLRETGIDGAARFTDLPGGNYTLRVEYLLVVYQTSFLVSENGMVSVPVPPPQWMIIVGIAIIVFAIVVLVRRKRKKNPDP